MEDSLFSTVFGGIYGIKEDDTARKSKVVRRRVRQEQSQTNNGKSSSSSSFSSSSSGSFTSNSSSSVSAEQQQSRANMRRSELKINERQKKSSRSSNRQHRNNPPHQSERVGEQHLQHPKQQRKLQSNINHGNTSNNNSNNFATKTQSLISVPDILDDVSAITDPCYGPTSSYRDGRHLSWRMKGSLLRDDSESRMTVNTAKDDEDGYISILDDPTISHSSAITPTASKIVASIVTDDESEEENEAQQRQERKIPTTRQSKLGTEAAKKVPSNSRGNKVTRDTKGRAPPEPSYQDKATKDMVLQRKGNKHQNAVNQIQSTSVHHAATNRPTKLQLQMNSLQQLRGLSQKYVGGIADPTNNNPSCPKDKGTPNEEKQLNSTRHLKHVTSTSGEKVNSVNVPTNNAISNTYPSSSQEPRTDPSKLRRRSIEEGAAPVSLKTKRSSSQDRGNVKAATENERRCHPTIQDSAKSAAEDIVAKHREESILSPCSFPHANTAPIISACHSTAQPQKQARRNRVQYQTTPIPQEIHQLNQPQQQGPNGIHNITLTSATHHQVRKRFSQSQLDDWNLHSASLNTTTGTDNSSLLSYSASEETNAASSSLGYSTSPLSKNGNGGDRTDVINKEQDLILLAKENDRDSHLRLMKLLEGTTDATGIKSCFHVTSNLDPDGTDPPSSASSLTVDGDISYDDDEGDKMVLDFSGYDDLSRRSACPSNNFNNAITSTLENEAYVSVYRKKEKHHSRASQPAQILDSRFAQAEKQKRSGGFVSPEPRKHHAEHNPDKCMYQPQIYPAPHPTDSWKETSNQSAEHALGAQQSIIGRQDDEGPTYADVMYMDQAADMPWSPESIYDDTFFVDATSPPSFHTLPANDTLDSMTPNYFESGPFPFGNGNDEGKRIADIILQNSLMGIAHPSPALMTCFVDASRRSLPSECSLSECDGINGGGSIPQEGNKLGGTFDEPNVAAFPTKPSLLAPVQYNSDVAFPEQGVGSDDYCKNPEDNYCDLSESDDEQDKSSSRSLLRLHTIDEGDEDELTIEADTQEELKSGNTRTFQFLSTRIPTRSAFETSLATESKVAAITIQRMLRGKFCREDLLRQLGVAKRRKWEKRCRSAMITQLHSQIRRNARSWLRISPSARSCMALAIRKVCSMMIQQWYRQRCWRRLIWLRRVNGVSLSGTSRADGAAIRIQKIWRGLLNRATLFMRFHREEQAAHQLQSFVRSTQCRHKHYTYLCAITILQRAHRSNRLKKVLIGLRRPVAQHESSGENIKDANRLSTTEALRSGKCQSLGNIVISQPLKNSQLEGAANNIATAEVVQQGHHHGRSHSLGTTSSRFRTSRVTTEWDQGGDWTMGKKNRDLSQQQHRGTQVHATNRPPPSQPKHLYATKELVERRSAAKAAPNSLALLDDDDAFLESKWDTLKTGYDTDDGDKKRKPKLRSSLLKRKGRLFRQKRITSERYKGGADDDVSSCSSSVTSNVLDNTDRSLSGDVSTLSSNKMPSRKSLPNSFSGSLASKLAPDATIGSSSNAFDADMNGMECPSPSKFTSGRRSSAPSPSMMVRRGKLRIHHQHAHVTGLANQQEAQLNDNDMEEYF